MPTPSWERCQPSGADNIPPPPNQPQAKERNPKLPQAIEQIPVSTPLRLCLFPLRARKRRAREAILSGFGLQIALENLKAPWSAMSFGKKVNCFNFHIHTLANFFSSATLFHLLIALLGVNVTFKAGCMEMQISVGNGYISWSDVLSKDPRDTVYIPQIVIAILRVLTYITPKSSASLPPPCRSITICFLCQRNDL